MFVKIDPEAIALLLLASAVIALAVLRPALILSAIDIVVEGTAETAESLGVPI